MSDPVELGDLLHGATLDTTRGLLAEDAEWWVAAGVFRGSAGFDRWRAYAGQVVRMFTVRGGRIVRGRSFYDTAAYRSALRV